MQQHCWGAGTHALTYMALNERRIGFTPLLPVLCVSGLVYDRHHSILVYFDFYLATVSGPMVMAPHHVVSRAANVPAILVVQAVPCVTGVRPNALRI